MLPRQFKNSCVIGVPSTTLPLMALLVYECTTPPLAEATPASTLPKIDELKIRTSEFAPLESTPFWKLVLIVLRSTMSEIVVPAVALIPLPRLLARVLSRTDITTMPLALFAFTPSELVVILLLLMTTTAFPPTAGCATIPPPVEGGCHWR